MIEANYIESVTKQFRQYQMLGEKAMLQVPDDKLYWQYNTESNSIAIIVKHLAGNMLSRFTDFFNSDGEKPWRNRDSEFENEKLSREDLMTDWQDGWACLFEVLHNLRPQDLEKTILIRNEKHTVLEAINRQLTHYPYHIGQIIFISKMIAQESWNSLSIPKQGSELYNLQKGLS